MTGLLRLAWDIARDAARAWWHALFGRPHQNTHAASPWADGAKPLWDDVEEVVAAVVHHHDVADQWDVVNGYFADGYEDMGAIASWVLVDYANAIAVLAEVLVAHPELARIKGEPA